MLGYMRTVCFCYSLLGINQEGEGPKFFLFSNQCFWHFHWALPCSLCTFLLNLQHPQNPSHIFNPPLFSFVLGFSSSLRLSPATFCLEGCLIIFGPTGAPLLAFQHCHKFIYSVIGCEIGSSGQNQKIVDNQVSKWSDRQVFKAGDWKAVRKLTNNEDKTG